MRTPNLGRLQQTMSHIENNLELWIQDDWTTPTDCGTAYCFAGWTVVLAGIPIQATEDDVPYVNRADLPEWLTVSNALNNEVEFPRIRVRAVAGALLGISSWDPLFHGRNSLQDLKLRVRSLCASVESETEQE